MSMTAKQIEFLTSRGWQVSDQDEGSVTIQTGNDSSIRLTNVQVFFDQLAPTEDPGNLVQNWMVKEMYNNPKYGTPGETVVKVHKLIPNT
jgi:hypothetical protein